MNIDVKVYSVELKDTTAWSVNNEQEFQEKQLKYAVFDFLTLSKYDPEGGNYQHLVKGTSLWYPRLNCLI